VAVAGFGGLRDDGQTLAFAPRLPPVLTRLSFRLRYRGRRIRVEVASDGARYQLLTGAPLELVHHGEPIIVEPGEPRLYSCPPAPAPSLVSPPLGREPHWGRRWPPPPPT
jgi:alpha,alpha-trehalose phosphorylase